MKSGARRAWPELHHAQRTVLLQVLIHGSRSRAELARLTGLSRATLMRLTRDLVSLGLITEGGAPDEPAEEPAEEHVEEHVERIPLHVCAPGSSTDTGARENNDERVTARVLKGRGRPSETLRLRPESAYFVGIKLTGDELYAVVTDLHSTVMAAEERRLAHTDVDSVVALISDVVAGLSALYPLTAVGVCLAGDIQRVDGRSVVIGSDFLRWDAVAVGEMVEAATGLPAAISNDVQALTLAHHWFGAGVGCSSLAVIGYGAGIGAGIVVDDGIIRGYRGHPGKVGHLRVSDVGPLCDRGHTGCVSAFVTIPAILRNAGTDSYAETLVLANEGNDRAVAALRDAGRALGVVVGTIASLVDPEKIVVTGEGLAVARIAEHLDPTSAPVVLELHEFRFADYAWGAAVSAIRHVVLTVADRVENR
jgi:predicted NBD/HSP70 family sugar kinase